MSKVIIEIEDLPENKVKVVMTPTFEILAKMAQSGEDLTSAHGYAMRAIRAIKEESMTKEPSKIWIPKLNT